MDPHRIAEARSLAYHQAVANRLATEPALLATAQARVEAWRREGRPYAAAWTRILALQPAELAAALVEDNEPAGALRQSTPFANALPPAERWQFWREVRSALER